MTSSVAAFATGSHYCMRSKIGLAMPRQLTFAQGRYVEGCLVSADGGRSAWVTVADQLA
jgi:hypothetical protein